MGGKRSQGAGDSGKLLSFVVKWNQEKRYVGMWGPRRGFCFNSEIEDTTADFCADRKDSDGENVEERRRGRSLHP